MLRTKALITAACCLLMLVTGLHFWFLPNCADQLQCATTTALRGSTLIQRRYAADINFSIIEFALSQLKFDGSGQVAIDASTESRLSSASSALPEKLSDEDLRWLRILITKSFPDVDGGEITDLLLRFHHYFLAQKSADEEAGLAQEIEKKSGLVALQLSLRKQNRRERLQQKYLGGELAKKLYLQQNFIARALIKMQMIDADVSLSDSEKNLQRQQIEKTIESVMGQQN